MSLWLTWLRCVAHLRPACRRSRSFLWLTVALAAITVRSEQAGITSFVRALALRPVGYHRLLHLFHSAAVDLDQLTHLWTKLVLNLFSPFLADGHLVCLADGIKIAKEGKKMPAVRCLHQASGSNSKPPFIMGHSLQAISILVRGASSQVAAIPLTARIHEGLRWSDSDGRTLLDKLVLLLLCLTKQWARPVILVADAYYASRKVITPLLEHGHHLITRAKSNTVAYLPPAATTTRTRGRPRVYGTKVKLKDMAAETQAFVVAPSPVYGERNVQLRYRCLDLMWRPVGRLVRFVIVQHPHRGTIYLMTTNVDLPPLDVILLYSYRFKIETGFRQAIYVLGSYAYHFWMKGMTPIASRSKGQDLQDTSSQHQQAVCRKLNAYHLHVQVACIAQGLMLHLAHHHAEHVWRQFRSWLRTADATRPPSELVVSYVLRDQLQAFTKCFGVDTQTAKFIDRYFIQGRDRICEDAA